MSALNIHHGIPIVEKLQRSCLRWITMHLNNNSLSIFFTNLMLSVKVQISIYASPSLRMTSPDEACEQKKGDLLASEQINWR